MPLPRRLLLAGALLTVALAGTTTAAGTPGSDATRDIVVLGQEQDVNGFNTALACCNDTSAGSQVVPVIRGAYLVNNRLQHVLDLVARARATAHTLSYTIRRDAYWNWGGKRLPVTYADFVYTWQQLVDPNNSVVDRDGYDQITGYTHKGLRRITFTWKQPYAEWQDLFSTVYPSAALQGVNFNGAWLNCICGSDGKPVADGPYYLASYAKGQGSTLEVNPYWYGRKPRIKTVVFRVMSTTTAEVQAMSRGELDAINPRFGLDLAPLKSVRGITYNQVPGLNQEHIDIQFGKQGNPLLRAPWMRRVLLRGIDRASLIDALFGPLAGDTKPLNSIVFYQADAGYRPHFARWTFNQKASLAVLRRHCTGGPATPSENNDAYFTCSGYAATFRYTYASGNPTRAMQEQIIAEQLKSIGIQIVNAPLPGNVIFTSAGIPSGNYDLANFAWVTSPDPGGYVPVWSCGGPSNFLGYCNRTATTLLEESGLTPDSATRRALFERADALFAKDVPTIPLYSLPSPLVRRSSLVGLKNNPSPTGFAWNIEQWHWRRGAATADSPGYAARRRFAFCTDGSADFALASGRAFSATAAGFAEIVISSPVAGLRPLRAFVAGRTRTASCTRPPILTFSALPSSSRTTSSSAASTAFASARVTSARSATSAISWDCVSAMKPFRLVDLRDTGW
jgi:peptide/nickel transport system substrate-binding protein